MSRVMCVHFPFWSLQRIRHQHPDLRGKPLAITRFVGNKGRQVSACCKQACHHGIRPGMPQAEAMATLPALTCMEEELDADRQALMELACWARQFSPIVGMDDVIAPVRLFLDTTHCDACFGGEEKMLRRACAAFSSNGWTVAMALADNLATAWAISQYPHLVRPGLALTDTCASSSFVLLPPSSQASSPGGERAHAALLELPIAALRLSEKTVALLIQLGIERIEQLAALPRSQISDKFGAEVALRLDQALGRAAEVIVPFHEQPEAAVSWMFEDPVERREYLARVLDLLLERLEAILEKRCRGARLLECTLEQEGAETHRFECSLSRPARTAAYLRPLLQLRLEQIRVQAPIRAIGLRALVLERISDDQGSLFDDESENDAALARLLDSLASRLGQDTVTKASFVADPQPELACLFASALASRPSVSSAEEPAVFAYRPLRLFSQPIAIQVVALVPLGEPQRFQHAGKDYTTAHCRGPERIETGWWRFADVRRDYYLVETTEGTHWWIFQRIDDGRWFLHGCFD